MRFSAILKSSPHCLPSPDGAFIATLLSSSIDIRSVQSLETVRTIRLPTGLPSSVTTFVWSLSSKELLLASTDQIHVISATKNDYHATIRNPSLAAAKSAFVDFGATDGEVLAFSAHGIKLSIFHLASSRVVEINNPKFHTTASATRGFSFRPQTQHLALLTRTSGKDTISIHSPDTREVQRSWSPDLVDAQGLGWTPDGRWLVVWESSAQGHRVLFYTTDGHKYRDWSGAAPLALDERPDYWLGAGVKVVVFGPNSQYVAAGDYSRCISVLHTGSSMMERTLQLHHPLSIDPKDTLQIWQEQSDGTSKAGTHSSTFVRASLPVSAPGRPSAGSAQELKTGVHFMLFDSSSALLAVILEEAPSTLWVWDVGGSELRAVLIFHAGISSVQWHPTQPELLLVRCEGDARSGAVFFWDPLSGGPQAIDFRSLLPNSKISGKPAASWLRSELEPASLFFADSRHCVLGSLADTDDEPLPWQGSQPRAASDHDHDQDPDVDLSLELVSNSVVEEEEDHDGNSNINMDMDMDSDDGISELDDTFHFKNFGAQ